MADTTASSTQPPLVAAPGGTTISTSTIGSESGYRYIVDSHTLAPGETITTVSGVRVAPATDSADVAIGTSTEALGNSISGGFGGGVNSTKLQVFTGVAERKQTPLHGGAALLVMGFAGLICL